MDKETLSQYGLILVSIMIVSVLIVFATPFGDYMGNVINSWRTTHRLAYGMKAIYIFT